MLNMPNIRSPVRLGANGSLAAPTGWQWCVFSLCWCQPVGPRPQRASLSRSASNGDHYIGILAKSAGCPGGNMDQKTCGPIPGGFIPAHTQVTKNMQNAAQPVVRMLLSTSGLLLSEVHLHSHGCTPDASFVNCQIP